MSFVSKKLELKDYHVLKAYYQSYQSKAHDLNLTNLMVWRKKYDVHYVELDSYLWIIYHFNDKKNLAFSQPIGDYSNQKALYNTVEKWIQYCLNHEMNLRLRNIDQLFKTFIENNINDLGFVIKNMDTQDDVSDYCYHSKDLAYLEGKKYHKKRNHINQFLNHYENNWRVEVLSNINRLDAKKISRQWCFSHGCESNDSLCYEYKGIDELLDNWQIFENNGVNGLIAYIDNQPEAFAIGEPLTDNTYVVHFEKANQNIVGGYAFINQKMAQYVSDKWEFINREPDLGILGLRKAKQSYYPAFLEIKWHVELEGLK